MSSRCSECGKVTTRKGEKGDTGATGPQGPQGGPGEGSVGTIDDVEEITPDEEYRITTTVDAVPGLVAGGGIFVPGAGHYDVEEIEGANSIIIRNAGFSTNDTGGLIPTAPFIVEDPGRPTTRDVISTIDQATVNLTEAQSGALIHFANGGGTTVNLPEDPAEGIWFEFDTLVNPSSVPNKVITGSGDTLFGYVHAEKASANSERFVANAALSDTTITLDGSTSGGLIGTTFRVTYANKAIHLWTVDGHTYGSGSLVTPFS
jgi:hypothetical protein